MTVHEQEEQSVPPPGRVAPSRQQVESLERSLERTTVAMMEAAGVRLAAPAATSVKPKPLRFR